MNRRLSTALKTTASVLLVASTFVAPAGRWTLAEEPTCVIIEGETACTIPPLVATGQPPTPDLFDRREAPQAPAPDPNDAGTTRP